MHRQLMQVAFRKAKSHRRYQKELWSRGSQLSGWCWWMLEYIIVQPSRYTCVYIYMYILDATPAQKASAARCSIQEVFCRAKGGS